MLKHLNPTDKDIERLALAETDINQVQRFSPLRYGPVGNLAVILFAGGLGLLHAFALLTWRKIHPSRRGNIDG